MWSTENYYVQQEIPNKMTLCQDKTGTQRGAEHLPPAHVQRTPYPRGRRTYVHLDTNEAILYHALTFAKISFFAASTGRPRPQGGACGRQLTWSRHLRTLSPVVSATGGPVGIVQPPAPLRHPFEAL